MTASQKAGAMLVQNLTNRNSCYTL